MKRWTLGAATGLLLGLAAGGCGGGDDAGPPAGPQGVSETPGAGSPANEEQGLRIESVRLEPREPAQGATLRAVTVVRSPSGDSFELGHRWFVDGVPRRADAPSLSLAGVRKGARVRVEVTATDGSRTSAPAEASVRVIDRIPSLTSVALVPADAVAPGQPVSARAMAVDPDGDPIEYDYTWYVNGEEADAEGSVFETDGLRQGAAIAAEIRAGDGAHWTEPKRTAEVVVGSAYPEITSTPPGFREDGEFRYEVEARDPDGDRRLRYALLEGPDGMAIDAVLGELLWRPTDDQEGVHPVEIEVRDSSGLATTQAFSVTVRRGEEAPPADADPAPVPR